MSLLAEVYWFVCVSRGRTLRCRPRCLGTPYGSKMTSVLLPQLSLPSSGVTGVHAPTLLSPLFLMAPWITSLLVCL